MSHQSGILPHADLVAFLAKAKRPSSSVRLIQIVIQNETLALKHHTNISHHHFHHRAWSDEYDELVLPLLDPQSPCYILYRTDTQDADGSFKWLFILWSPDTASVRDKMLYASTKATLKRAFGEGHIENELFGTIRTDVTLKAYKQARRLSADGDLTPLTHAEREMRNMRLEEAERASGGHHNTHVHSHIHVSHRHVSSKPESAGVTVNHMHAFSPGTATITPPRAAPASGAAAGVAFPIADDAVHAIDQFVHHKMNYVQLSIDLLNERILLESSRENLQVSQLTPTVPRDKARYHLYRYSHVHTDGQRYEPVFFIYSVPSDFTACPAKERMIYSSCKGPLVEQLQYGHNTKVHIDKKLEVSSDDLHAELGEANLRQETHATAARATHADDEGRSKTKFDKPQGPTGTRGPRRLVR